MNMRYISEPEKVDAERRAMEEAAEAERKAIAKREAAKEKARKKAEKHIEDEKNHLIWPLLVQFVDDIRSGVRKIGSDDYALGTCKAWKSFKNTSAMFFSLAVIPVSALVITTTSMPATLKLPPGNTHNQSCPAENQDRGKSTHSQREPYHYLRKVWLQHTESQRAGAEPLHQ